MFNKYSYEIYLKLSIEILSQCVALHCFPIISWHDVMFFVCIEAFKNNFETYFCFKQYDHFDNVNVILEL